MRVRLARCRRTFARRITRRATWHIWVLRMIGMIWMSGVVARHFSVLSTRNRHLAWVTILGLPINNNVLESFSLH